MTPYAFVDLLQLFYFKPIPVLGMSFWLTTDIYANIVQAVGRKLDFQKITKLSKHY